MIQYSKLQCRDLLVFALLLSIYCITSVKGLYKVGAGIADITGPIAEVGFMGYAKAAQKGSGLHLRQFARAFIIEDKTNRITFVSIDTAMVSSGLRQQVLEKLSQRYNSKFKDENFILSATHTHSAPGGFMMDILFDITTWGFVKETFNALVSGIVKAVSRAHVSVQDATIHYNSREILNININRSPQAYLLNPESERKKYKYNVDKEMSQLVFVSSNNELIGAINWFPLHPTSMNNTNTLVSSDNMGYASVLLEQRINKDKLVGQGPFVAAFASSNLGDVSPNIRGPHCLNTGESCDNVQSTCDGEAKVCIASGPGKDMFDSTRIIAEGLYRGALELLQSRRTREEVSGPVKIRQKFVDMPSQVVDYVFSNGTKIKVRGCVPAMGYSFAAGTTDGPGEFDFKQGTISGNEFWNTVRNFLAPPTDEDIKCHAPKPILLDTGRIQYPYEWQPRVVTIQIAMIGNVAIASVPGEFTTMSGRRLKSKIKELLETAGKMSNVKVIVAGLSNLYSDYITTPEEYELQRYEAASTIFGPHTLTIYLDLYSRLAEALIKNLDVDQGIPPPDLSKFLISLLPPVLFDTAGWGKDFGECIQQPQGTARPGDTVIAKFIAGHPRNNVMHEKTFLKIEKLTKDDEWVVVATDANWETRFKWTRTSFLTGESTATIEWDVTREVEPGTYRIRHFGNYKYILGGIFLYEGISNNINVI